MTKKEVASAISGASKAGLARIYDAVKSCPKSVKALTAKSKKQEAQRELKRKKDIRLDLLCL